MTAQEWQARWRWTLGYVALMVTLLVAMGVREMFR